MRDIEVLLAVEYSMSQNSLEGVNVLFKERHPLAHLRHMNERNMRYPEEVCAWSTV